MLVTYSIDSSMLYLTILLIADDLLNKFNGPLPKDIPEGSFPIGGGYNLAFRRMSRDASLWRSRER